MLISVLASLEGGGSGLAACTTGTGWLQKSSINCVPAGAPEGMSLFLLLATLLLDVLL